MYRLVHFLLFSAIYMKFKQEEVEPTVEEVQK